MTQAQKAVGLTMLAMITEIGEPLTEHDWTNLRNILQDCKSDSFWGLAIRKVFDDGGDVEALINGLADQAMDDVFTMSCIVGKEGTRLLLRTIQTEAKII